jgi:hypothetical protein
MRVLANRLFLVFALACASGCGIGGGKGETPVPNPLAPGEIITVNFCGATTEPRGTCGDSAENVIQVRVAGQGSSCPCFTWAFLNQSLTDTGSPAVTTYEFMGFRPGTYQVTGRALTGLVDFTFWHNSSTSKIGVVPSSLQSLSGPAVTPERPCSIKYLPGNGQLPASFSFQFAIAAVTAGGTC